MARRRKLSAVQNGDKIATVYKDAEWGEFVVKLKGRPEADYHTSDLDDAKTTAKSMVGLGEFYGARSRYWAALAVAVTLWWISRPKPTAQAAVNP